MNKDKLKILFITQDDPFYVKLFFEEFFKNYSDKVDILGVAICPPMAKKSVSALIQQMYDFFGPIDFIRMCWRYLLAKLSGENLKKLCKQNNIAVCEAKNPNSANFIDHWQKQGIDVLVSVAAPYKFKEKLLKLAKIDCINIHHAKLPRYQGMMPNFWQMYHQEKNAGVTVHRMNEGIDQGDILLQKEVPVEADESLDHLIKRTKRMGAHFIMEALELIRQGKAEYKPNDLSKGVYFCFPTKQHLVEFRRRGGKLL